MEGKPNVPKWLQPLATATVILVAALLIAGLITIPYRAAQAPHGYDQPREHLNTKNTTRFDAPDLAGVARLVGQAAYPGGQTADAPQVVLLYPTDNWASGLQATSLLKPLNGLLLPDTEAVRSDISRLWPGAQIQAVSDMSFDEMLQLRQANGEAPRNAILVDPKDPATALLAAPWAAYSGDLVIFDPAQAPAGVKVYSLGNTPEAQTGDGTVRIAGRSPEDTAVQFARFQDPANPFFGWGFNANTLTGYRAFTLARLDDPAMALLSATLAVRGKPGPLLWTGADELPQVVNDYLWSQRAAFWVTPVEGPFHHVWVLGDAQQISFPAQSQADYALEIGPYLGKGAGMSGIDMLAAAWVILGLASALWIVFHQAKFLTGQMWIMRLAWPLLAMLCGPFGILFYTLAYKRPVIQNEHMTVWDRPLWLQGLVATASAVGFGASLMVASGYIVTSLGLPLIPGRSAVFFLGTPMILLMVINFVVAVLVSWPLFQTPMMAMFHGLSYQQALPRTLPMVLASMAVAALAMNPSMWWLMMDKLPMTPDEESILWFGIMFFTGFLAFLLAWPLNYALVRLQRKGGLM